MKMHDADKPKSEARDKEEDNRRNTSANSASPKFTLLRSVNFGRVAQTLYPPILYLIDKHAPTSCNYYFTFCYPVVIFITPADTGLFMRLKPPVYNCSKNECSETN
jgi:hypothetical protein